MEKLISLSQLKVGTRLKIVAKSERNCYGSVSVKILKKVMWDKNEENTEVIINRKKNRYFNLDLYFKGESSWVNCQ